MGHATEAQTPWQIHECLRRVQQAESVLSQAREILVSLAGDCGEAAPELTSVFSDATRLDRPVSGELFDTFGPARQEQETPPYADSSTTSSVLQPQRKPVVPGNAPMTGDMCAKPAPLGAAAVRAVETPEASSQIVEAAVRPLPEIVEEESSVQRDTAPPAGDVQEVAEQHHHEARRQILDQILLDAPTDHEENEHDFGASVTELAVPQENNKKKGKSTSAAVSQQHPVRVLAQVGTEPISGKAITVYMDRNKPYWTPCCCRGRIKLPVFHPEAKIRVIWNVIGFFFIVFESFLIPFYIAFDYEPSGYMFVLISVVNVYFMIDVCFNFFTGFVAEGALIMSIRRIVEKYMTTWFVPDVLSGIPWEWIPADGGGMLASVSNHMRFVKGLRLLRIMRLLRLMRMGLLGDDVEVWVESNQLFVFAAGVLRVLFLLFGMTHWGACAWYMVGTSPGDDAKDNWIDHFMHDVSDVTTRYVYALYFTLTTMTTVGYGDIVAQNFTEVKFVLLLLLVASIVFAGLMGALTDLISNLNNDSNERSKRKIMLSRYMRWRAVPNELFMAVREHLIFLWETNEFDEYEDVIIQQLPPTLQKELSYHIYGRILRSAPFLAWMRGCEPCLKELALAIETMFLSKGDYLFHVGTPNDKVYVLLKGTLYISQNEKLDPGALANQGVEDLSEEASGFTLPRNREANAMDVFKMVLQGVRLRRKRQDHADKKLERLSSLLNGPQLNLQDEDSDQDWEDQREGQAVDVLESHVDSRILNAAFKKLMRNDSRRDAAARYLQRRWKRSRGKAFEIGKGKRTRLSAARSKHVHAPAYLGESCLWAPVCEWGSPQPLPYAARCESRGEFCCLSRDSVKTIIDRFSPWLITRFEFYRQTVIENMQKVEEGKQEEDNCTLAITGVEDLATPRSTAVQEIPQTPTSARQNSARQNSARSARNGGYDMVTKDLAVPSLPGIGVAASPRQCSTEEVTQGRKLNPYFTTNHTFHSSSSVTTPLALVLSNKSVATRSTRSFRMAAAAAVARVAQRVNPPPSAPATPSPTPRGAYYGSASPRSPRNLLHLNLAAEDSRRLSDRAETLQEPLLQHQQERYPRGGGGLPPSASPPSGTATG